MRGLVVLWGLLWLFVSPIGAVGQNTVLHPNAKLLVDAAIERTTHQVTYDGSYHSIRYPGGDVPDDIGVCTDVVIRSYRALGVDLQVLVHEDMKSAFKDYPNTWGLQQPDPNIDHRRVPNLQVFFSRQGAELPVTNDSADYLPGDLVTWMLPGNLPHIGAVIDRWSESGGRPLIVHNIGAGPEIEDVLFSFEITGHYRYRVLDESLQGAGSGSAANPSPYSSKLESIKQNREAFFQQFENARTDSAKTAILKQAGNTFVRAVAEEVAPFWYGTPWDFNGTTEVPGSGTIACGYFVTTVLRDVGVNLDRVRLAQEPSETMIKDLVGPEYIKRFSEVPIDEFLVDIREWGEGLYVVGLDVQVGFIVYDDKGIRFIHSSYVDPVCVVEEGAAGSVVLTGSRYRVLGKLSGDHRFVLAWLKGESTSRFSR